MEDQDIKFEYSKLTDANVSPTPYYCMVTILLECKGSKGSEGEVI